MVQHALAPSARRDEDEPAVLDRRRLAEQLGHVLRAIAIEAHGQHARTSLDRDERRRVELGLD